MRRVRKFGFDNAAIQAMAVSVVSGALAFLAWYALWPFGARLQLAVACAFMVAVVSALGSVLRGHDVEWERRKVSRRQSRKQADPSAKPGS